MKINVNGVKIEVDDSKTIEVNSQPINVKFIEHQDLIIDNILEVIGNISVLRQRYENISELEYIDGPLHEILNKLEK